MPLFDDNTTFAKHIVKVLQQHQQFVSRVVIHDLDVLRHNTVTNNTWDALGFDLTTAMRNSLANKPALAIDILVDVVQGFQPNAGVMFSTELTDWRASGIWSDLIPHVLSDPDGRTAFAACMFVCLGTQHGIETVEWLWPKITGCRIKLASMEPMARQKVLSERFFGPVWSEVYGNVQFDGKQIIEYIIKVNPPMLGYDGQGFGHDRNLPELGM